MGNKAYLVTAKRLDQPVYDEITGVLYSTANEALLEAEDFMKLVQSKFEDKSEVVRVSETELGLVADERVLKSNPMLKYSVYLRVKEIAIEDKFIPVKDTLECRSNAAKQAI